MYEFASVFGKEIAKMAGQRFNGRRFYFTDDPGALEFSNMEEKRKHFRRLNFYEGMTPAEIADMYRLTSKRVMEIINGK